MFSIAIWVFDRLYSIMPLLSCVRLEFCQTLSDTMDRSPQAPVSVGFSRQEYWGGLPYSPPGDPPDAGVESASLKSPAWAGRFFTISANWEGLCSIVGYYKIMGIIRLYLFLKLDIDLFLHFTWELLWCVFTQGEAVPPTSAVCSSLRGLCVYRFDAEADGKWPFSGGFDVTRGSWGRMLEGVKWEGWHRGIPLRCRKEGGVVLAKQGAWWCRRR